MKRYVGPTIILLTAIGFVGLMWWLVAGTSPDVLNPTGRVGKDQLGLIVFTVLLSAVVVVPVFIMLIVFAWRYRQANLNAVYRPEWAKNTLLEAIWWGIPILIIVILGIVTWVSTQALDPHRPLDSDKKPLKVQVVALQWKWLFIYPEEKVATVNVLPIEIDRPVELSLSADAPMSAFWVPSLGSQIYSMNGMSSKLHLEADKLGTYWGYNTNINGRGYSDMKFPVKVMETKKFNDWTEQVRGSSMALDWRHYQQLAEPSQNEPKHYMRLADEKLYDKIMSKYMGHSHTPPTQTAPEPSHEGMGH